jgi:homoserine dehydrogenase
MSLRIGLVGFGTVGRSVARRLVQDGGRRARLVRVCGRPGGRERAAWLPASVGWTTRFDDLAAPDIDVVVELVGGIQPARQWLHKALLLGKSVVTANKQLVAEHGPELIALAARRQCAFRYEGAVAGGVPVIRAIEDGLAGDRLVSVTGILNGTCNHILTRMEQAGLPFAEALSEAQALGYAEADPTADIDGIDARAKLSILCQVAFGIRVRPSEIECQSIAGITLGDLARARAEGCAVRQVSSAARVEGSPHQVVASVRPTAVCRDSPFARAGGGQNVVAVRGEFGGETVFTGQGAGGDATAVAVVSDVLAIAASKRGLAPLPRPDAVAAAPSRRRLALLPQAAGI